jgi:ATP-dependent protease HslVU (ClpYQ) peptidase subunit
MTTIAASVKHQSMSADSRMCYGGTYYEVIKIRRLADGSLIGSAGDVSLCAQVERYIEGGEKPTVGDGQQFEIIVLRKDCIIFYPNQLEPVYLVDKVCAIGSGGEVALAALRSGKSPKQAVEMALTVDVQSFGPVYTRRIH